MRGAPASCGESIASGSPSGRMHVLPESRPHDRAASSARRTSTPAWLLALVLLVCGGAQAQGLSPPLADYAHDTWTTRDGLPHNTVVEIAQTREGYLWLASWEGLVRYNGIGFRSFDRTGTPALPDNAITAVHAGADGELWFADSRGHLGRWQPGGRWRFWTRDHGLPGANIDALLQDPHKRLWMTLNGVGVGRLDTDGAFRLIEPPPGMNGFVGLRPAWGPDGRLWIGTLGGLLYVDDDDRLQRAPETFGLGNRIAWPYRAPDGRMWVIAGETIYRMDGTRLLLMRTIPHAGRFTAILQDRYGDLWLGTENRGVLRIGRHGVETIDQRMGLPEGRVATLFQDRENSIWIGMNGGVYRLREALFSAVGAESGLGGDFVRTLVEDLQGTLWVGGSAGLDRIAAHDGRVPTPVPVPLTGADSGAGAVSVLSLQAGAAGEVWAGTYGDGIYHVRDGRPTRRYGRADGLPSEHVRSLALDASGTLWAGTRQGVAVMQADGRFRRIEGEGIPNTVIYALLAAPDGIWIGTLDGVTLLRDGRGERIDIAASGGARSVLSFYRDPDDGAVWISTDRGLYRHREGRLARVGLEQGLPVDTLFQMVVDAGDSAWIGSNRGVLRVDYAELGRVADGMQSHVRVDLFGTLDGMRSAQGNGGSGPSTLLRRDGSVWFATAQGAAVVHPGRLERFRTLPPPPVVIEGADVDGKAVLIANGGVVRIPAGTRRLSISFVGLSYLLPQGIRYRTRLDGFDDAWVSRGNRHVAEFTSLPPGDYVFRVAAANVGRDWNSEEATWRFVVEPQLWQRRGFQAAMAAAILLLLAFLYRARVQRYRRRAQRLSRLVDERTSDLVRQTHRLETADQEKQQLLDQLREQAGLLARQAHEDELTGLPNRRRFEDVSARHHARASEAGSPLSLAILDIDRFKRINDEHSHAVGDEALRHVARIVRAACREQDLVARLGGEEFAIVLPDTALHEAVDLCERVRDAVERFDFGTLAPDLAITVSIGVADDRSAASVAQMMAQADQALYVAKRSGRNQVQAAGASRDASH